jgi:4-carboxymuconolactone decarboxylase
MHKDRFVTSLALFCGLAGCGAFGSSRVEDTMKEDSNRFEIGVRVLREVGGEKYDAPLRSLDNIAPDLARFIVEFAYGDIMSRKALDLRTRQIATVAALAAMANARPQLKYHVNGALNVGVTPSEIIEAIMLSAVYAGFPATLNGVSAAREVFQERQLGFTPTVTTSSGERYTRGMQALERISAGSGMEVITSLQDIAPDLARFIIEFSYGDVIGRDGLDNRVKELATVALLTALGTADPQLRVHVGAALNVGATRQEIVEIIQQMAVYAGFPAALNGIAAARDVFGAQTR